MLAGLGRTLAALAALGGAAVRRSCGVMIMMIGGHWHSMEHRRREGP
jgi:hypothetical protein